MKLLSVASFPRAILHLDADAFFASVEAAKDTRLKGKPVVVGGERGIAASFSYEAKALGITRAMPIHEIRRRFPQVIITNGDYDSYMLYSARMFDVVRRYSFVVDEYSIDECFADLTGMRRPLHMTYEEIAQRIQDEISAELDINVSIGISLTKTLAKVGSKLRKPRGLVLIPGKRIHEFLAVLPVGNVWGIGPNTNALLHAQGVHTALDFVTKDESWITERFSKPFCDTWKELRGQLVFPVTGEKKQSQKSISKTRTFTPPSADPRFVFAQLSKNIENACIKARRFGLASSKIFLYLKTQEFRHYGIECELERPTNIPQPIIECAQEVFSKIFRADVRYRASGVVLAHLVEHTAEQTDLFGGHVRLKKFEEVYASIDELSKRYGKHTVFLGSTMQALHMRDEDEERVTPRSVGKYKSIGIPVLGTVM